MPNLKWSSSSNKYKFGFNGKENDNEVNGEDNFQNYGMRMYDPRLGRFPTVDPMYRDYPEYSPYAYCMNRPIDGIDLDGLEFISSHAYYDSKTKQTKYVLKVENQEGPLRIQRTNYNDGHQVGDPYMLEDPGDSPEWNLIQASHVVVTEGVFFDERDPGTASPTWTVSGKVYASVAKPKVTTPPPPTGSGGTPSTGTAGTKPKPSKTTPTSSSGGTVPKPKPKPSGSTGSAKKAPPPPPGPKPKPKPATPIPPERIPVEYDIPWTTNKAEFRDKKAADEALAPAIEILLKYPGSIISLIPTTGRPDDAGGRKLLEDRRDALIRYFVEHHVPVGAVSVHVLSTSFNTKDWRTSGVIYKVDKNAK